MPNLDYFTRSELEKIADNDLLRVTTSYERFESINISKNGKKLISFACNDYFGLSAHPLVRQAAMDAIVRHGTGACASRLITGTHPLYDGLEHKISEMKGVEASLVFGSGYLANIGVINALMTKGDLIIADKFAHACMIDGALLSGAKLIRYSHNDLERCESVLQRYRKNYRHCLIITETVFSMDGDLADMHKLNDLAHKYDSWLLSDDAHGFGTIPHEKIDNLNYIQIGTLSKAVGSYGGYVSATRNIIEFIKNKARSFIFSTGLPPAVIGAASAALDIIKEDRELTALPLANARLFTRLMGMEEATSQIVAWIMGEAKNAVAASAYLEEKGYLVSAIRPPTVHSGTSRLRFTFSSLHKQEDIENIAALCRKFRYD